MIIELFFTKGLLFGKCILATILSERSTSGTEILHEIGFVGSFCLAILVPGAMIERRFWILVDRISNHYIHKEKRMNPALYADRALPVEVRVTDLLARMTLAEKCALRQRSFPWTSPIQENAQGMKLYNSMCAPF